MGDFKPLHSEYAPGKARANPRLWRIQVCGMTRPLRILARVEIGAWHGVTTLPLSERHGSDATLLAVDPFQGGRLDVSAQRMIAHLRTRSTVATVPTKMRLLVIWKSIPIHEVQNWQN